MTSKKSPKFWFFKSNPTLIKGILRITCFMVKLNITKMPGFYFSFKLSVCISEWKHFMIITENLLRINKYLKIENISLISYCLFLRIFNIIYRPAY